MKRKTMGWLIVFLLFISLHAQLYGSFSIVMLPLIEKELGFNAAEME